MDGVTHNYKSPHCGHLKNLAHLEKGGLVSGGAYVRGGLYPFPRKNIQIVVSALLSALKRKSSVKTHRGKENRKEEQAIEQEQ